MYSYYLLRGVIISRGTSHPEGSLGSCGRAVVCDCSANKQTLTAQPLLPLTDNGTSGYLRGIQQIIQDKKESSSRSQRRNVHCLNLAKLCDSRSLAKVGKIEFWERHELFSYCEDY